MLEIAAMTTEELEAICRADADRIDDGLSWEELEPILEELARRRKDDPGRSTPEKAWERFLRWYAPRDFLESYRVSDAEFPHRDEVLTPSFHGAFCRHNGESPEYEIACDECDYYLTCFPDWEEMLKEEYSWI